MKTGTIIKLDPSRPFAFVAPDSKGEPDVFLHRNSMEDSGHEWSSQLTRRRIGFDTTSGPKGLRAVNVCLL